jgi:hypothetical protein
MLDDEGSRGEFLKLLVELGEEPAFIERARAPQVELDALLRACAAKRDEMLKWPTFHLSNLARHVCNDWSRLAPSLDGPESVALLQSLHTAMQTSSPTQIGMFATDKRALRRFLESADRFNRHWRAYLDGLDLEPVNKPRREYNQFFVVEQACAFGSEMLADKFVPLPLIDRDFLYDRFPLLALPRLA